MSPRALFALSAVVCGTLASCTVYPEGGPNGPHPKGKKDQATVSQPDQQEIQKKRDELKKRDEELAKKQAEQNLTTQPPEHKSEPMANTGGNTQEAAQPKPKAEKKDYPFANPVPGKDGFVFSPYNNKVVDVRDIPSGTLVQDPTYPQSDKKYFRVP